MKKKSFAQLLVEMEQLKKTIQELTTVWHQEEWLDNADMMLQYKISYSTLYRWRKHGKIPFTTIGSKCYYPKTFFNDALLKKIASKSTWNF